MPGCFAPLKYTENDAEEVAKDDREAARWYRSTAEKGNPAAEYSLGWMSERGEGVPRSIAETRKWYQKAANQGNTQARGRLARLPK